MTPLKPSELADKIIALSPEVKAKVEAEKRKDAEQIARKDRRAVTSPVNGTEGGRPFIRPELLANAFLAERYNKDGFITLTEEGKALSEQIYQRHDLLTRLLIELGVSKETAAEDACKMEHVISPETFLAIQKHFETK